MAERIVRLAPPGFGTVFSVSSGSEAVENAVKFARQYQVARGVPSKHLVISRWQSYHGNTLAALAYSGHTGRRRKHAPTLKAAVHIPPAFCYGHLLIGPPLVITSDQVDDAVSILSDAVGAVERELSA